MLVGWDGEARGLITVTDTVKPTSAAAVAAFRSMGLRPVLLTGDHAAAAHAVAREVGIDEVVADVLPADKAAVIRERQAAGQRVAMVGDGVNDAAALAQADLGIALGSGSDAAIAASDLTLVRGDLRRAADAIRLARATLRTIKGNLVWAFAYNIAALPLAMAGYLNPMVAGAAMALSSLFVVGNSLHADPVPPRWSQPGSQAATPERAHGVRRMPKETAAATSAEGGGAEPGDRVLAGGVADGAGGRGGDRRTDLVGGEHPAEDDGARRSPKASRHSATVGGTVATQSRP